MINYDDDNIIVEKYIFIIKCLDVLTILVFLLLGFKAFDTSIDVQFIL